MINSSVAQMTVMTTKMCLRDFDKLEQAEDERGQRRLGKRIADMLQHAQLSPELCQRIAAHGTVDMFDSLERMEEYRRKQFLTSAVDRSSMVGDQHLADLAPWRIQKIVDLGLDLDDHANRIIRHCFQKNRSEQLRLMFELCGLFTWRLQKSFGRLVSEPFGKEIADAMVYGLTKLAREDADMAGWVIPYDVGAHTVTSLLPKQILCAHYLVPDRVKEVRDHPKLFVGGRSSIVQHALDRLDSNHGRLIVEARLPTLSRVLCASHAEVQAALDG